jgi:hypothetical protein
MMLSRRVSRRLVVVDLQNSKTVRKKATNGNVFWLNNEVSISIVATAERATQQPRSPL